MSRRDFRILTSIILIAGCALGALWAAAQNDETGIVIVAAGDYRLEISRVWTTTSAGTFEKPDRDLFLIFEITLCNDGDAEAIFYGKDFPAHLADETYELQNMKEMRNEYYEGRDYPGFKNGQPVAAHSSEPSLLVYDVAQGFTSVTIEFNPDGHYSQVVLRLISTEDEGDFAFVPDQIAIAEGYSIAVATFTATPPPTNTLRPTLTPVPPATLTPTVRPQTRYVTAQQLNARQCIGVECQIVTTLVYGDSFVVTGQGTDVEGAVWYSFTYENQTAWAAGWYTSTENPEASQPTASQPAAQPPPAQPAAQPQQPAPAPAVRGAAASCQTGFDFAVCAQYAPAPSNCDEVVARGIPARVAACCFPACDRDKDGVACYGD